MKQQCEAVISEVLLLMNFFQKLSQVFPSHMKNEQRCLLDRDLRSTHRDSQAVGRDTTEEARLSGVECVAP